MCVRIIHTYNLFHQLSVLVHLCFHMLPITQLPVRVINIYIYTKRTKLIEVETVESVVDISVKIKQDLWNGLD